MISATFQGLMDELEKISERLTEKEKRERDLKFMALGTVSGPVVAGTRSALSGARAQDAPLLAKMKAPQKALHLITGGAKMRRWLPASLATGALVSGAVPAGRRLIERDMKEKAKARREKAGG